MSIWKLLLAVSVGLLAVLTSAEAGPMPAGSEVLKAGALPSSSEVHKCNGAADMDIMVVAGAIAAVPGSGWE